MSRIINWWSPTKTTSSNTVKCWLSYQSASLALPTYLMHVSNLQTWRHHLSSSHKMQRNRSSCWLVIVRPRKESDNKRSAVNKNTIEWITNGCAAQNEGDESHLSYLCNFRLECWRKMYSISMSKQKRTHMPNVYIIPLSRCNRMCWMIIMCGTVSVCMDRQGKFALERVYLRSAVVSLELIKSFRYSKEYYWIVSASEIIINVHIVFCVRACSWPDEKNKRASEKKEIYIFFSSIVGKPVQATTAIKTTILVDSSSESDTQPIRTMKLQQCCHSK